MKAISVSSDIISKLIKHKNEKKINTSNIDIDKFFKLCYNKSFINTALDADLLIFIRPKMSESDAESNFPLSYTYTNVDLATEESTTWDFLYHEDTPNNLANITPDFAPISESKFLSSGIEDDMIYTNFDVVFEDWTTGNVLYINDPETLNFVAATVESQGHSINYQYAY